ncbi:unnamed protein product [Amoebophrya sp. A25]|nr:unnamed protein product [Amoebophrya sp. A25]|eukprot:GSA25T00019703001.1
MMQNNNQRPQEGGQRPAPRLSDDEGVDRSIISGFWKGTKRCLGQGGMKRRPKPFEDVETLAHDSTRLYQARMSLRQRLLTMDVEKLNTEDLVDHVKLCQKLDAEVRTAWIHYTTVEARGVRDPSKQDLTLLQSFFRGIQDGTMENYFKMRNPHRGHEANEVFVGGIGVIAAESVEAYFRSFGPIRYIDTKKDKGFGFIKFENREIMDAVLQAREHVIEGKRVEVKAAENRAPVNKEARSPDQPGSQNPGSQNSGVCSKGSRLSSSPASNYNRGAGGAGYPRAGYPGSCDTFLSSTSSYGSAGAFQLSTGSDYNYNQMTRENSGGNHYYDNNPGSRGGNYNYVDNNPGNSTSSVAGSRRRGMAPSSSASQSYDDSHNRGPMDYRNQELRQDSRQEEDLRRPRDHGHPRSDQQYYNQREPHDMVKGKGGRGGRSYRGNHPNMIEDHREPPASNIDGHDGRNYSPMPRKSTSWSSSEQQRRDFGRVPPEFFDQDYDRGPPPQYLPNYPPQHLPDYQQEHPSSSSSQTRGGGHYQQEHPSSSSSQTRGGRSLDCSPTATRGGRGLDYNNAQAVHAHQNPQYPPNSQSQSQRGGAPPHSQTRVLAHAREGPPGSRSGGVYSAPGLDSRDRGHYNNRSDPDASFIGYGNDSEVERYLEEDTARSRPHLEEAHSRSRRVGGGDEKGGSYQTGRGEPATHQTTSTNQPSRGRPYPPHGDPPSYKRGPAQHPLPPQDNNNYHPRRADGDTRVDLQGDPRRYRGQPRDGYNHDADSRKNSAGSYYLSEPTYSSDSRDGSGGNSISGRHERVDLPYAGAQERQHLQAGGGDTSTATSSSTSMYNFYNLPQHDIIGGSGSRTGGLSSSPQAGNYKGINTAMHQSNSTSGAAAVAPPGLSARRGLPGTGSL